VSSFFFKCRGRKINCKLAQLVQLERTGLLSAVYGARQLSPFDNTTDRTSINVSASHSGPFCRIAASVSNRSNENIQIRTARGKMDDENASCAHDGEEDAQLSLLDLPVEVCKKKEC